MTWANIAMLRSSGSTLPVEVWHLPGEITHAGKELLRIVGAKARLIRAAGQREGYSTFHMHWLRRALMRSSC